MKIVPITERWNEGERDWSFVKDPRADIEAWEKREGLALPATYRRFMLRYNGGRVYPRTFRTTAGWGQPLGPYVSQSEENYCDRIHDWAFVLKNWRGEIYGKGVPPGHLVFADTPGAIQLLMSVKPGHGDHGHIYSWAHSTIDWGGEGNDRIFPLAADFSQFLLSLHDDEQKSDGKRWSRYETLARELEL